MSEWKILQVEDIVSSQKYSCIGGPFGSNLTTKDYVSKSNFPVIRGNNFIAGDRYFYDKDFVFISEEKAESLIQNSAYPGDLVFTQRGTIGQVALIPYNSKYSSRSVER
jgi:type I restriction enzyme S subunit